MDITRYVCSETPDDWGDGAMFDSYVEARDHAIRYGLCVIEVTYSSATARL